MSDLHGSKNPLLAEARILIDALLDDALLPPAANRLEQLLAEDAHVRQFYVLQMHLWCGAMPYAIAANQSNLSSTDAPTTSDAMSDTMILPAIRLPQQRAAFEEEPTAVVTDVADVADDRGSSSNIGFGWRRLPWKLAAGILLPLVLAVGGWMLLRPGASPATYASSVNAQWNSGSQMPQVGRRLPAAAMELKSGLAKLQFQSGASVIVEGPARFRIRSGSAMTLDYGKLSATVPTPAHGFTVQTPSAQIVDLGTEFGVVVQLDQTTHLEVFRGTVAASPLQADGSAGTAQIIAANEAIDLAAGAQVVPSPSHPMQFVRQEEFESRLGAQIGSSYQRWLAYSANLLRDPDLVAYYTFDTVAGSPDRLPNHSSLGPSMDGLLGGDDPEAKPTWATGRWPQKGSLSFVGGNFARVIVPSAIGDPLDFSAGNRTARPFTLAMWIRVDVQSDDFSGIAAKGLASAEQFGLDASASINPRTWVRSTPGMQNEPGFEIYGPSFPLLAWTHLVTIYDPARHNIRLYVNGEPAAERDDVSDKLLQTDQPFTIGARRDAKADDGTFDYLQSFEGRIDELAILRRAISAEQVREMFQAGRPD